MGNAFIILSEVPGLEDLVEEEFALLLVWFTYHPWPPLLPIQRLLPFEGRLGRVKYLLKHIHHRTSELLHAESTERMHDFLVRLHCYTHTLCPLRNTLCAIRNGFLLDMQRTKDEVTVQELTKTNTFFEQMLVDMKS